MPSPTCQVKDGGGAYQSTINGVDVTPASTITIGLEQVAGAALWSIACIATDELTTVAAINATLVVDALNKTATFTAPGAGSALIFRSVVGVAALGQDANSRVDDTFTTTFGIYTLAAVTGYRVAAVNEELEGSATFGWVTKINPLLRAFVGGGGVPTGAATGALTGTYPSPGVNVSSVLISGTLAPTNGGTGIVPGLADVGKFLVSTASGVLAMMALSGDVIGTYDDTKVMELTGFPAGDGLSSYVWVHAQGFYFDELPYTADDPSGTAFIAGWRTTDLRPLSMGFYAMSALEGPGNTFTTGGGIDFFAGRGSEAASLEGSTRFWNGGPAAAGVGSNRNLTAVFEKTGIVSSVSVQATKLIIGEVASVTHSYYNPAVNTQTVVVTSAAGAVSITKGAGVPTAAENNGSVFLRDDGTNGATGLYTRQAGAWFVVGAIFGGDLTEPTPGTQRVVALTGAAGVLPIASTAALFTWVEGTASPGFVHAARTSNLATTSVSFTSQAPVAGAATFKDAGGFTFNMPEPVATGAYGEFRINVGTPANQSLTITKFAGLAGVRITLSTGTYLGITSPAFAISNSSYTQFDSPLFQVLYAGVYGWNWTQATPVYAVTATTYATSITYTQVQAGDAAAPATWNITPQAPGAAATNATNGTPGSFRVNAAVPVNGGAEAGIVLARGATKIGWLAAFPGVSTYTNLWLGSVAATTPTVNNYALASSGTDTRLQGQTSASIYVSGNSKLDVTATLTTSVSPIAIGTGTMHTTATVRLPYSVASVLMGMKNSVGTDMKIVSTHAAAANFLQIGDPVVIAQLDLMSNGFVVVTSAAGSGTVFVHGSTRVAGFEGSNFAIAQNAGGSYGSGVGVFFMLNAPTAPTTAVTGGGVIYVEAGAGKFRGSSGTVTTFGPAEPHCPRCDRDFTTEYKNDAKGEHFAICLPCMRDALETAGVEPSKFMIFDQLEKAA